MVVELNGLGVSLLLDPVFVEARAVLVLRLLLGLGLENLEVGVINDAYE